MGSNMMDEIDCANFFDQIDDLIDFLPEENCEGVGANGGFMNSGGFPVMWNDDIPNPDVFLSKNASADLSAELYVPYEDIVQLEWISTFVEDSFSKSGLSLGKDDDSLICPNKKDNNTTGTTAFVLESSSSSSSSSTSNSTNSSAIETKPSGVPPCGPQRARSKRARPANFSPRPPIQLVETTTVSAESDPPQKKKVLEESDDQESKKKKKEEEEESSVGDASGRHHHQQAIRKCAHCEITKTPQWRAGPAGPKTLCNACGVRYKSGRLFPEYRPAASPTFVPSVHSNSHKKVVEMRNKAGPAIVGPVSNEDNDHKNNLEV